MSGTMRAQHVRVLDAGRTALPCVLERAVRIWLTLNLTVASITQGEARIRLPTHSCAPPRSRLVSCNRLAC